MTARALWTLVVATAVAFAGCATPRSGGAALVPSVDHHQHLASADSAALMSRPRARRVDLPPELAQVLDAHAARWNDAAAIAPLYTDDALVLTDDPRWLRGRRAAATFVASRFARPYRMTAVALVRAAAGAHVAGFFTRGDGLAQRFIGRFYVSLVQESDGWRIAVETLAFPGTTVQPPVGAGDLIAKLDEAGIRRAVVLSDAYFFDAPMFQPIDDPAARVREENDWTAEQVARFPDRLVAFCSFNPLAEHALRELERCASSRRFKGVKLNLLTSGVDLDDREHVRLLARVFAEANRRRLPIVLHARDGDRYGRAHAEILLREVLPASGDVPVQIAHLWGGEAYSEGALAAYADAVAARAPGTARLFFDVSDAVAGGGPEVLDELARRIRQIGLDRILYGSDALGEGHPPPKDAWNAFATRMPLSREELAAIAANVAPYLR